MTDASKKSPWTATFTGRRNYMLEPEKVEISVRDVAHMLALKTRWNGASSTRVSIAQHSVMVSQLVADWGGDATTQLLALFHDAGEAYTFDLASPYKALPEFAWVIDLEKRWLRRIVKMLFGVPFAAANKIDPNKLPEIVRRADEVMLQAEAAAFMPPDDYWIKRWEKLSAEFYEDAQTVATQKRLLKACAAAGEEGMQWEQRFLELYSNLKHELAATR